MNFFQIPLRNFKTNSHIIKTRRIKLAGRNQNLKDIKNGTKNQNVESTIAEMIRQDNKRKENLLFVGVCTFCTVGIVLMI